MTERKVTYLALPSPISTNQLYANVRGVGRRKTKLYKAWCKLAADYLRCQGPLPCFTEPVDITLQVGEEHARAHDIDNTAKAMLDALKEAEVIVDDSLKWVRSCHLIWVPKLEGTVAAVRVAQEPIDADAVVDQLSRAGRDLVEVRAG